MWCGIIYHVCVYAHGILNENQATPKVARKENRKRGTTWRGLESGHIGQVTVK